MTNWLVIQTYTYPQDAYIAKSFLESEGIEVLLKDELTAQVYNFYSNAIGGVKIMVKEVDYNRGIEALKAGGFINIDNKVRDDRIEILELKRNTDTTICPFCNSNNIGRKKEPNILTVIVFFILGAMFPIFRRSYKCFECGKEWKYLREKK